MLQFAGLLGRVGVGSEAVGAAARHRYNSPPFRGFFFANEIIVPNTGLGFLLFSASKAWRGGKSGLGRPLSLPVP